MLQFILEHRLDCIALAIVLASITFAAHLRLRKRHGAGIGRATWAALLAVIFAGAGASELAGNHERNRLHDMLQGIAPTYAQELSRMGHSKITLDTKPDDAQYLSMIEAEKRWLKVNPGINDVYTFRKTPDGKVRLIVDSETDYNRNGIYDEEREQRTAIGEEYEADDSLLAALSGKAIFDGKPYTDRWGMWVSAYAPMFDENGQVDGVTGVDYDAKTWITSILFNRVAALGFASIIAVILVTSSITISVTHLELKRRIAAETEREALQQQLVEASRAAGMAEIATGVLHNVGNVLNSVNVSAGTVAEKIRGSKVTALGKAVAMMQQHQTDLGTFLTVDDKGKQIPTYLAKLADFMTQEQSDLLGELDHLNRSVDHIKQIVAAQQKFAKHDNTQEAFGLPDVLEDAIRMNIISLGRHGVEIKKQYAACPTVFADKHKVLQILVNLISNAKKAVDSADAKEKKITLVLQQIE